MGAFLVSLEAHKAKSLEAAEQIVRKTVFGMGSLIVLNTPVDTGRLRANWQYGRDQIPGGALPTTDKAGGATIGSISAGVSAGEALGHIHYVANSLPYAMRIEYGFVGADSLGRVYNQGPQAMVGRAMLKADEVVRQAAASVA